jgi:Flp pilus assembly protein TadG
VLVRRPGRPAARRGATLVETAVILSVLFLVLFGIVNGAIAVFRYQQCAHAAREGSRWAAVRNTEYAFDTGNPPCTAATIRQNAVLPQAIGMDPAGVGCNVTWNLNNEPYHTEIVNGQNVYRQNMVSVTVSYTWNAGVVFGPLTVSSTSVSPVLY